MLEKEYLEDLNQAIYELEKTHPDLKRNMDVDKYEKEKREALLVNYCNKEELLVQIAKIYAMVNDSHTSIRDDFSNRLKLKLLYEKN